MLKFLLLSLALFAFTGCSAKAVPSSQLTRAAKQDLITKLPGLNFETHYQQFSGYLNVGDGVHLHYWFIESSSNPKTDPLLLWLNGGPGCSSLDGLLNELGPFHIKDDGKTLYNNTYSWNTFTNILYLESPACVGFSYSENNCSASDDSTSLHNYNALKEFFTMFPSYRENPFFVTGESYGGIYVPTLSVRIVENNASFPINFQGFAVGNGLSSNKMNEDSLVFFANYHGLLGKILWNDLVTHCCDGSIPTQETCHFSTSNWPLCYNRFKDAMNIVYNSGLNMYNLYDTCVTPSSLQGTSGLSRYNADKFNVLRRNGLLTGPNKLTLDPPCTSSKAMSDYLNSPEVRAALHITDKSAKWDICNDEVNEGFERDYSDMRAQYLKLHAAGIRGLVYNGDVDMACNFIGDQWFVESLGLQEIASRRIWKSGGQVGGFVKRFKLLDLVTVRGSGHMVPQDKPQPSLDMIKAFVLNKAY